MSAHPDELSQKLLDARNELRFSQLQMAKAMNISKRLLQQYESGDRKIKRQTTLLKLYDKIDYVRQTYAKGSAIDISAKLVNTDATQELINTLVTVIKQKDKLIEYLEIENEILKSKVHDTDKKTNEKKTKMP